MRVSIPAFPKRKGRRVASLNEHLQFLTLTPPSPKGEGESYWQASHSGLSMEQNLASSDAPSPAPAAAALFITPEVDTAFSSPPLPVDFSAEEADSVRR